MLRGHSIESAAKQFFADNTHFSPVTTKGWRYVLASLQGRYPNRRINEVTSDDLKDFLLLDDQGKPRDVAPGTIKQRRSVLTSFFSWCQYAGLIDVDPAAVLKRTVKVKATRVRKHTWLTEHEVASLFAACRADENQLKGQRDAVMIGLGLLCGLRVHEIVKLTWNDLNLRAGQLFVIGKGSKAATLPVPPRLVELLTDWHAAIVADTGGSPPEDWTVLVRFAHKGGEVFGTEGLTFPMWGNPIGNKGVGYALRQRGLAAGIPELRPHDLRRSYAGLLEDRGVGLRDISSVLRHSSIATTERYLADNPKKWQDSVSNALAGIG